ncbi:sulfate ABC transporter substrate-binding protein [Bacillus ginsengihumi]|uniref:Sulfate ABC transporter substrate-binding protein n=1 Tax=Heyndrickxia ginsengihumi TaxID=363870 RepID=A0A6M0PB27_9BACI|nr:sulfate ABC transporter substrate-binding protein [Heyndrickxia ginsengihumi]
MITTITLLLALVLSGCSSSSKSSTNQGSDNQKNKKTVTLTIGGYSTIKDEFEAIFPLFQKEWKKKTGQTVVFKESYQGSGSQALNITNGFEADIAALSLEGDIDKIVKAGLITHNWKSAPHGGIITKSIVAFGVRNGNPKKIHDWADLTKKGVQVLLPDPKTSGGARWDVNAIYGAGLKSSEEKTGKKDPEQAKKLLSKVYKNVKSLDKSGEESMSTFDKGNGDVIITYENELIDRIKSGKNYEEVIPKYTTSIENPAAVVDKYVDKHGTRKVAEAFLKFLWSPQAQKIFAESGFRPVDSQIAKKYADKYTQPAGLFTTSYLGGWNKVGTKLYGDGGIWDQVVAGN